MTEFSSKALLYLLAIMIFVLSFKGICAGMTKKTVNLPKTIGVWTQSDSIRIIDASNIFNYMNGAGELYLGYCFNHLEVFEYTAENQPKITVEIYSMKTSDDAFGLLSLDWGGEPILFNQSAASKADSNIAPSSRALYGRGLLRVWSDNNYCRILASRETTESREAINELHRQNLKVVMLTGDTIQTAKAIGSKLTIDEIAAEVRPEEKSAKIKKLQENGKRIGMVGDGINDTPALASADVGIAMGVISSDAAIETADVALMEEDLRKIPRLIARAKRTMRIVKQNVALSISVKAFFGLLAVLGYATLWMAIAFGDMGLTLVVIANALRLPS